METNKQQQLELLLRNQQSNQLSSEEEPSKQLPQSRSQHRKPLKNAFSQSDSESQSDNQHKNPGSIPLPPKPPKQKTILQQAQEELKWTRQDTTEIDLLTKLEGNGMKDKKIRELANKIKSLNLSYERQKTLRRNLQNQLNMTLKANQQSKKQDDRVSLEKTTTIKNDNQKCGNCSDQQKKIMQFRLKYQNVKTQINKYQRLFAREIGENFDIDQALSQQNGWKGRQQKIEKLKARVKQMQQKLVANGVNVSQMSGFTQGPSLTKNGSFSATQRTTTLADNKRKQLQNLKVQVEALRSQNDLLQGKVKSLTSRKLTLQSEVKQIKSQFEKKKQIFVEKSQNDDRFITLLKQQNDKLKKDERVVTKVVYKDSKENNQEVDVLRRQIQILKKKLKQFQSRQAQNQKLQQTKISSKQIKAMDSVKEISVEKRKQLQQQYVKGNKYLKKMSVEDQEQIYRTWKQSKTKL